MSAIIPRNPKLYSIWIISGLAAFLAGSNIALLQYKVCKSLLNETDQISRNLPINANSNHPSTNPEDVQFIENWLLISQGILEKESARAKEQIESEIDQNEIEKFKKIFLKSNPKTSLLQVPMIYTELKNWSRIRSLDSTVSILRCNVTTIGLVAEVPYHNSVIDFTVKKSRDGYKISEFKFVDDPGCIKHSKFINNALASCPKGTVSSLNRKSFNYFVKSRKFIKREELSKSITALTKAIEANPKFFLAYYCRAYDRNLLGDKTGALSDYSVAIKYNQKFAFAYNNRGNVRDSLGDSVGAIKDFKTVIKLTPDFAPGYSNLGTMFRGDKETEQYDKALQIDPNYLGALQNRAHSKFCSKDYVGSILDSLNYKKIASYK